MNDFSELRNNPLKTRSDLQKLAKDLVTPLASYFDDNYPGHLNLGSSGTVYPKAEQEVEAFLRPLWAIGPLLSDSEQNLDFFDKFRMGLVAGTDPASSAYWGDLHDTSQLMEFSWLRSISFDFCNKVKDKGERREAHTSPCWVTVSKIPRLSQSFGFGRCAFFRGDFVLFYFPLFARRAVPVSHQLSGSGGCAWC